MGRLGPRLRTCLETKETDDLRFPTRLADMERTLLHHIGPTVTKQGTRPRQLRSVELQNENAPLDHRPVLVVLPVTGVVTVVGGVHGGHPEHPAVDGGDIVDEAVTLDVEEDAGLYDASGVCGTPHQLLPPCQHRDLVLLGDDERLGVGGGHPPGAAVWLLAGDAGAGRPGVVVSLGVERPEGVDVLTVHLHRPLRRRLGDVDGLGLGVVVSFTELVVAKQVFELLRARRCLLVGSYSGNVS